MSAEEWEINDPNWRDHVGDEIILLGESVKATEYEVMLAIEKLTPIIQEKYGRSPNEDDIIIFICMLRGGD